MRYRYLSCFTDGPQQALTSIFAPPENNQLKCLTETIIDILQPVHQHLKSSVNELPGLICHVGPMVLELLLLMDHRPLESSPRIYYGWEWHKLGLEVDTQIHCSPVYLIFGFNRY